MEKTNNKLQQKEDMVSLRNLNSIQKMMSTEDMLNGIGEILPKSCGLTSKRLVIGLFEAVRKTFIDNAANARASDGSKSISLQSLRSVLNRFALFGLDPIPNNPEGYAEIYDYTAKFSISYRGIIRLVKRSGKVLDIDGWAVYENDDFKLEKGNSQILSYTPAMKNPGEVLGYVAHAALSNGWHKIEFMRKDEIDKIKNKRRGAGAPSPWEFYYDRMARKTVIWRLCRELDISTEDISMAMMDADWEDLESSQENSTLIQSGPKTKQLMAKLKPQAIIQEAEVVENTEITKTEKIEGVIDVEQE